MSEPTEQELLMNIFSSIIRKERAAEMSSALIERFGTLTALVESMPLQENASDIPENIQFLLGIVPHVHRLRQLERLGEHPLLNTLDAVREYVSALYAGIQYEQIALLCLDKELRLIECCLLNEGSLKEVAFYPRRLLQEALNHQARAVLLCHNHPSNWGFFSESDVASTRELLVLCRQNHIALADHLLIAGERISSMRCRSYISDKEWRIPIDIVPPLAQWRGNF